MPPWDRTNVDAQTDRHADDGRPGNSTDLTHWTTSSWAMEELERKSVEFRVPTEDGVHVSHGVGQLWVRRNPRGLLALEVVTDDQGKDRFERTQIRRYIPQAGVDRLEKHPDQVVAEFRLFMV